MPRIRANGIELHYEDDGDPAADPVLLVMGLGAQLIVWPPGFWKPLVAAGLRVIRFDNRDVGLSQRLDHLPVPHPLRSGMRWAARRPLPVPYGLEDMAKDTIGLADALGLERFHLIGASMGGMIAQIVAARHSGRLHSLHLIMSSPGGRGLPGPHPRIAVRMLHRPRSEDRETRIRYSMRNWRLSGSRSQPASDEELYRRSAAHVDRSYYPAGYKRQFAASLAAHSRAALCRQIRVPTLVMHGTEDALVPPAHGRRLAELIPGARLELVEQMGHDFPLALQARLAGIAAQHCIDSRKDPAEIDSRQDISGDPGGSP